MTNCRLAPSRFSRAKIYILMKPIYYVHDYVHLPSQESDRRHAPPASGPRSPAALQPAALWASRRPPLPAAALRAAAQAAARHAPLMAGSRGHPRRPCPGGAAGPAGGSSGVRARARGRARGHAMKGGRRVRA
eukprot:scaffold83928_cov55-Phaeocystis_antarctica.AAC.3